MVITAIVAIVLIIMGFLKVNPNARSNKDLEVDYEELSSQVRTTNWDELIDKAVSNGQLNLAVRFLFLKMLKELDAAEKILWSKDKTNADYRRELTPELTHSFDRMTYNFEYSWFGEFIIDKERYELITSYYHSIKNKLR